MYPKLPVLTQRLRTHAGLLLSVLLVIGCQSGRELHYFKEADNYYRLTIRQCAFLSSSRYVSGYFEEGAVNRYFGELARPDSARLTSITAGGDGTTEPRPCEVGMTNRTDGAKLVMVLSTNADAITEQISNLAKNEQVLETMARLANRDAIKETEVIKRELARQENLNKALIGTGEQFLAAMDTAGTEAQVRRDLLAYLNYTATLYGENVTFTSMEEARIWFLTRFGK